MGDPKKKRRQYSRPQHLWREKRLTEEGNLCKKYGLKNGKEIWKVKAKVRKFRKEARDLLAMSEEEGKKERKELISSLKKLGIDVKNLEDVLALDIEDLLDRRLGTLVYKKGLANTTKQARQFITHGHVIVRDKVVDIPSYLVPEEEESEIRLKEEINVPKPEKEESG